MLALTLSLILTGLLLALPAMTWWAYNTRRKQADRQRGKVLFRLLAGCAMAAWSAQIIRYIMLASAQGPVEVRQAAQLTAPLGWLVWLAALMGLAMFAIILIRLRRS